MTDDAEELARLTQEANVLIARTQEAYRAWVEADAIMRATIQRRELVAARLRAQALATTPAAAPPPAAPPPVVPPREARAETSTRTVQNVLFILGGLLLGTAAIVFTAVAWATFGVGGRAAILGIVTLIMLALPFVALWRRLQATAETFAAVGLLLVLLDGYAAWAVDLLDVRSMPGTRYTGLVCALTAAVGLGYRAATKLVGPTFAAVAVMQPVVPLLVADARPSLAGWGAVFVAVAALNLLVVLTGGLAVRVMGWVLYGAALIVAVAPAVAAVGVADTRPSAAWAAVAVVLVALTLAAGAALTRSTGFGAVAAGTTVFAVILGASRYASVAWPDDALVLIAAVIAVVAVLAAALPAGLRVGGTVGALIAAGLLALYVSGWTVYGAVATLAHAQPLWSASLDAPANWPPFTWQLPVAIGLTALAIAASVRGRARLDVLVVGAVVAILAAPASFDLAWWAPSVVDLAGATVLALVVTRRWVGPAYGSAVLVAHGVGASLARPSLTATVLAALVVIGLGLALPRRSALAAPGLVIGLSALPPAVGAALVWADAPSWWVARLTTASVALVLLGLVAVRRELLWHAFAAALGAAVVWPNVAGLVAWSSGSSAEPVGVYAAVSLVAVALALLAMPRSAVRPRLDAVADGATPDAVADEGSSGGVAAYIGAIAAVPGAIVLAIDVVPAILAVVAFPYGWLSAVWSGTPAGPGLIPAGLGRPTGDVRASDAIALAVLSLASAIAVYAVTRRLRSALGGLGLGGPAAILVALAATQAPWPTIPAVTLLMGLSITMLAALLPIEPARATVLTVQGLFYIGAGLAGALAVEWATIAAFGSTVVAAAIVGAVGRSTAWRAAGWLAAGAAALAAAASAGFAADLAARNAAFAVLGAATATLVVEAILGTRRPAEAAAANAAAHAGAVVALLFTVGWATHAAAVCTLWGVAVGLRALWPGTTRTRRITLAAVAAGFELLAWWLLIADRGVALVEAYTLPLAAVALLAGFAALRARPELRSWVAYGPALAAAFLPSLATILGTTGDPTRRLALGAGALAVVVAGSMRRRQAPVVVGGLVLAAVALHEIAVAWQLLPGWLPLGVGGVILVLLAITYERRRRDVRRLREALSRMS